MRNTMHGLDAKPALGMAYSDYIVDLLREEPGLIDYVEVPFEQLLQTPQVLDKLQGIQVILHCASLSIAGNAFPTDFLVDKLLQFITATRTPWLGEHLAYVRTDGVYKHVAEHVALVVDSDHETASQPYNIGYTVSPQMSEPVLRRVLEALDYWQGRLAVPVLIENGPIYFSMPGSTMSQVGFVRELCRRSGDTRLLLDLAHLAITAENLGEDAFSLLETYPVERVVEVHLSGTKRQADGCWDDHSEPAPAIVFALLERLLTRTTPRAITLEYNWNAHFPRDVLFRDLGRVRGLIQDCDVRQRSEVLA